MEQQDYIIAGFGGLNFDSGDSAPGEFMFAPGGVHKVTGDRINVDGSVAPLQMHVRVDKNTAERMNGVLRAYQARGQKPYFDFNHAEAEASAWPEEFAWKDGAKPGVYVKCAWSKPGNDAVVGKTWRTFSPAFGPDKWVTTAESPAIMAGGPLVMGGLVNDPAFKKMAPFWARNSHTTMDTTLTAPPASAPAPAAAPSPSPAPVIDPAIFQARDAELKKLKDDLAAANGILKARNAEKAEAAVRAAQARGALPAAPAKDSPEDKLLCRWRTDIEADPTKADMLDAIPGVTAGALPLWMTAGQRGGGDSIEMGRQDIALTLRNFKKAVDQDQPVYEYVNAKNSSRILSEVLQAPRIYGGGIRKLMETREGCMEVLRCANQMDRFQAGNALGTLAGILVVQRRLDLLKYEFPELTRVTTDFSAEPVQYAQQVTTRITVPPTVASYAAPPGAGYADQNVTDTDVNVTINNHHFTQITYSANDLASTVRLLFPEQEEGMHFSMGLDLVNTLLTLVTPANFVGQAGDGSINPSGLNVPGKTVAAVDQFNRKTVILMKAALHQRGAISGDKTLLLDEQYHAALEGDTTIVGNLINIDSGRAIATSRLPKIASFQPYESPYLPSANNLVGFGFRKDALVMAARLPNNYADVFPGVTGGGVTQIVTNPDTGLSVMLVMFLSHSAGTTSMRIAWMFGVAIGNQLSGQILTSQ